MDDLLSPSELLDSPLYFDDIDQALHECGKLRDIQGNSIKLTLHHSWKLNTTKCKLEQTFQKFLTFL